MDRGVTALPLLRAAPSALFLLTILAQTAFLHLVWVQSPQAFSWGRVWGWRAEGPRDLGREREANSEGAGMVQLGEDSFRPGPSHVPPCLSYHCVYLDLIGIQCDITDHLWE